MILESWGVKWEQLLNVTSQKPDIQYKTVHGQISITSCIGYRHLMFCIRECLNKVCYWPWVTVESSSIRDIVTHWLCRMITCLPGAPTGHVTWWSSQCPLEISILNMWEKWKKQCKHIIWHTEMDFELLQMLGSCSPHGSKVHCYVSPYYYLFYFQYTAIPTIQHITSLWQNINAKGLNSHSSHFFSSITVVLIRSNSSTLDIHRI